jgi:hypothetical protein
MAQGEEGDSMRLKRRDGCVAEAVPQGYRECCAFGAANPFTVLWTT